jgi:hypothetical protein
MKPLTTSYFDKLAGALRGRGGSMLQSLMEEKKRERIVLPRTSRSA